MGGYENTHTNRPVFTNSRLDFLKGGAGVTLRLYGARKSFTICDIPFHGELKLIHQLGLEGGLDPNQVSITSSEWKVWRVTFAP